MSTVKITFPDGAAKEFPQGVTGMQITESISNSLAKKALAISVNDAVWDLSRPINIDASIKILTWDSDQGKTTYWHSSAHLMRKRSKRSFRERSSESVRRSRTVIIMTSIWGITPSLRKI